MRQVATADDMISLLEAAPVLGVSPFTVRAWVRERRVPFYRVGRRIVFSRSELEAYKQSCRVPVREETGR